VEQPLAYHNPELAPAAQPTLTAQPAPAAQPAIAPVPGIPAAVAPDAVQQGYVQQVPVQQAAPQQPLQAFPAAAPPLAAPTATAPTSAVPSPVALTAVPSTHTATERSFFKSDKSKYAGRVEVDGQLFEFDALEKAHLRYANSVGKRHEANLGEAAKKALEELTPEEQEILFDENEATADYVIAAALRKWTLPVEFTPENKRDLHLDVKNVLTSAIISFSMVGSREARFRQ
jgi:hypothetical protein